MLCHKNTHILFLKLKTGCQSQSLIYRVCEDIRKDAHEDSSLLCAVTRQGKARQRGVLPPSHVCFFLDAGRSAVAQSQWVIMVLLTHCLSAICVAFLFASWFVCFAEACVTYVDLRVQPVP